MTTKSASRKPARSLAKAEAGETTPGKNKKKDKKDAGKAKVVRDSFTMPQADYELIAVLKQKALKAGLQKVKKSELLRAGLQVLDKLSVAQLKRAMASLEKIKTGRPKKS